MAWRSPGIVVATLANPVSLGAYFLLCVAVNCEQLHGSVITLLGEAQQKAEVWRDPLFSPGRDRLGLCLRSLSDLEICNSVAFLRIKCSDTGRVNTVLLETWDTRLITFLWRLTEAWGHGFFSSRAREEDTAIFILPKKAERCAPPSEVQHKQHTHTKFTDHRGLQRFSSRGKQYITFFAFLFFFFLLF